MWSLITTKMMTNRMMKRKRIMTTRVTLRKRGAVTRKELGLAATEDLYL